MRGLGNASGGRRSLDRRGWAVAIGSLLAVAVASCGQEERPGLGAGAAVPTTVVQTTTSTAPTTTSSTIDFARPVTQATAALADEAGPEDVAALVADIRGQSANVSAQVQRLAPFPDLGIAPIAQISGLDLTLGPEEDDLNPSLVTVRFRVPATEVGLVKGIADRFDALAWYQTDQTRTDGVDGITVESVFRIPGFDPDEAEFRSSVTEGGQAGAITVELTSVAKSDRDDVIDADETSYYERLASWQEPLALTRVADLTEVGIETAEESGIVFARYTIQAEDEAEAIARLALASARGDYELLGATADAPPTASPLRLVGENGTLVIVEVTPGPGQDAFVVEASHGFELTPLD